MADRLAGHRSHGQREVDLEHRDMSYMLGHIGIMAPGGRTGKGRAGTECARALETQQGRPDPRCAPRALLEVQIPGHTKWSVPGTLGDDTDTVAASSPGVASTISDCSRSRSVARFTLIGACARIILRR